MAKLNPLPPTLREKERWVVFRIIAENKDVAFPLEKVVNAIWNACIENFGSVGCASMMLWVPANLYDEEKGVGIIRCTPKTVEMVRFALATIREIEGIRVVFHVLGVSGTIKRAKKKFMSFE